jgi:C4-dicarboxylate-binding protein DctP
MSVITSVERPIVEPGDFEGLRIRTVNEFSGVPFAAVSARPGPLGAGRVYAEIEAGNLDAVMTDVSSSVGLRLDEVQKAATLAPYFSAFYHLFVSTTWLDGLAPRHRRAIEEAASTLVSTAVTITEARAAASVDILRARGVALHVQTDAERQAWIDAMQGPTIDAFERQVPGGKAFLELLPKE